MIQIIALSVICAAPSHLLPILAGFIPLLDNFSFFPLVLPLQPQYTPPPLPPPPSSSPWFFFIHSQRINVVVASSVPMPPTLPTVSTPPHSSRQIDYLFACGIGLLFCAPLLVHIIFRWFRFSAQRLAVICLLVCTFSVFPIKFYSDSSH